MATKHQDLMGTLEKLDIKVDGVLSNTNDLNIKHARMEEHIKGFNRNFVSHTEDDERRFEKIEKQVSWVIRLLIITLISAAGSLIKELIFA